MRKLVPAIGDSETTITQIHSGLVKWINIVETFPTQKQLDAWYCGMCAAENPLCKILSLDKELRNLAPALI